MGQHDLSYRQFFNHPRMIQDLLREIVGEQWVELIDLDSAERVNSSFAGEQLRYRLVDESKYSREELAAIDSPVADLFRIETSRDWSEVRASVHRLRQTVPPTEPSLRQAFETWLGKVILPRFGVSEQEAAASVTLEELETMLAESIDRWNREIRDEGRQEGESRLLLRQLRLKFGHLEPEIEERVRSADADRLLKWGDRVLTAERLQDVFRD